MNDGPQGLKRLDNIVETAGKYGVKIILAFTNNWVGYGVSQDPLLLIIVALTAP